MSEKAFDIDPAKVGFIEETTDETLQNQDDSDTNTDTGNDTGAPNTVEAERYDNLRAAFTRVTQENSDLRKQITDIENRINQVQNTPNTPVQNIQQPPTQDGLDKVIEDYEELKPFVSKVRQMEQTLQQQQEQLKQAQAEFQRSQQSTSAELHTQKILAAHPDATKIGSDPDFIGWIERQPSYMKHAIAAGTAEDVIAVLAQYKSQMNNGTGNRQQPSPAIGTVALKTTDKDKPVFTSAQIAAMSDAEFIRREEEIQQAQLEGRVLP